MKSSQINLEKIAKIQHGKSITKKNYIDNGFPAFSAKGNDGFLDHAEFEEDGIDSIASLATEINQNVENIGARRLHTIMEKLLEEVSFNASDIGPTKIIIDKEFVETNLVDLIKSQDLSKFIL